MTEIPDALRLERTFDAPVALVWRLWTEPKLFKRWFGPSGATIPVAELDVRVGGRRLVCMEFARTDGVMRMWFAGEHLEVEPTHLLVYTEAIADEHGRPATADATGVMTVRVELTEVDGRTRQRLTHVGIAPDSPGASGWTMAFDKLAAAVDAF